MTVLVIDAQGGGIGKQLVAGLKKQLPEAFVWAVGTNAAATGAMLKAGADRAATGENAAVVACRSADLIMGPIGIVIADSLFGEITAAIAAAVGRSSAKRILVPFDQCETFIPGYSELPLAVRIQAAVDTAGKLAEKALGTEAETRS